MVSSAFEQCHAAAPTRKTRQFFAPFARFAPFVLTSTGLVQSVNSEPIINPAVKSSHSLHEPHSSARSSITPRPLLPLLPLNGRSVIRMNPVTSKNSLWYFVTLIPHPNRQPTTDNRQPTFISTSPKATIQISKPRKNQRSRVTLTRHCVLNDRRPLTWIRKHRGPEDTENGPKTPL